MIVELDMFSGLPNPRWELGPQETQEFQRRALSLSPQVRSASMFDGLGYRGLIVRDPKEPESLTKVGFGTVLRVRGKAETLYADEGRAFETWLVSTGKGKIDDHVITGVLQEISVDTRR